MKNDDSGLVVKESRPIFLHSQFRCGSTFLFNRFRSCEQYYAYYEPLHHDLIKLRHNKLDLWGHDSEVTEKVNHPELKKPHFYEFQECFNLHQRGLPYFHKKYSYDDFYHVQDGDFTNYIENILKSAPSSRQPVLQFNRTSMRVDWFADNINNALNITLIRNPRDQFDSYVKTGHKIFLVLNLIIITRSSSFNLFAKLTRELKIPGYVSDDIRDEIRFYSKIHDLLPLRMHYKIFLNIWLEAYKHSISHADLIINMNRLSKDMQYRKDIEKEIAYDGLFDGYYLNVNQQHCLKDREIFKIESEVFFDEDKQLISRLREEYYFEETSAVSFQLLQDVKKSLNDKISSLIKVVRANNTLAVPVISIITPSYNQGKYIEDTIKSVIGQEGVFFIDYIIMDGASTDDSMNLVNKYKKLVNSGSVKRVNGLDFYKNNKTKCSGISFRSISEKDNGQADAINKGFLLSKGEVLGWLNSDDIYYSKRSLSSVVKKFTKENTNFIYGRGIRVDENGVFVREEAYVNNFKPKKIKFVDFILQPSAFWRRCVFDDLGALQVGYHYVFDWEYWMRISQKYDLIKCEDILSCYRVYSETKTSSGGIRRELEIVKLLKSYKSYNEESRKLNGISI